MTDNYLAAEQSQNQIIKYFTERVIQVCKSKGIGSTIQLAEEFLLSTVENVTLSKKVYDMVYNTIAIFNNFKIVSWQKKKLRNILKVKSFGGRIV